MKNVVWLLVFLLLLTGCKQTAQSNITLPVPDMSSPQETTAPIIAHKESQVFLYWHRAGTTSTRCRDFDVDTSSLIDHHLYTVDYNTGEIAELVEEPVRTYASPFDSAPMRTTNAVVYYVTEAAPGTLIRSTWGGEVRRVVTELRSGTIDHIVGANDYVVINESCRRIVKYDLESGVATVLLEQENLAEYFTYNEDKEVLGFRIIELNEEQQEISKPYRMTLSTGEIEEE